MIYLSEKMMKGLVLVYPLFIEVYVID